MFRSTSKIAGAMSRGGAVMLPVSAINRLHLLAAASHHHSPASAAVENAVVLAPLETDR